MSTRLQEKNALILLRERLIGELHTLPYTIYSDETIEDLLDARPQSIEELVQVKGFPETGKRVKGFGEAVVQIFVGLEKIKEFEVKENNGKFEVITELHDMSIF